VILQDRKRRSPRNRMGANLIIIDDMCDQAANLMETCTMRIADRLHDLGGTVRLPVLLDKFMSDNSVWDPSMTSQLANGLPDKKPLDAFGQSVLDAVTMAAVYGDTATAEVMKQIWRGVDRQLWKVVVQRHTCQKASRRIGCPC